MGKKFYINLIKTLAPMLLSAIDRFIRKRVKKEDFGDVVWINQFIIALISQFNVKLQMSDVVLTALSRGEEPDTRHPSFDEAQGTPIVDYHKNDNA